MEILGKNNQVIIVKDSVEMLATDKDIISGLNIKISGNDNIVKLHYPINALNSVVLIESSGAKVEIGSTEVFYNVYAKIRYGFGQSLSIGRGTTMIGTEIFINETGKVEIGEDCMFSDHITIWGSDAHTILDIQTGEILNRPIEPIHIGNHVWVGQHSKITKGSYVGNNSVIGLGSIVCKKYKEDNVVIAGNPAKIIKRGITGSRKNTYQMDNNL